MILKMKFITMAFVDGCTHMYVHAYMNMYT